MDLFLSFFTAVAISIVLIPILMRWADSLHMLDQPDERKVHTSVIPRCGGIGLAIGAITALLLFITFDQQIAFMIAGGCVIVFFGIVDDRIELSYKWKFSGQLLAVSLAMLGGIYINIVPFGGTEAAPLYLSLPLTVFFVIGVTNAVNLSDGLDGLAAGIMLMTFATIAFFALIVSGQVVAIMALAVAGGIAGFLWFNTHPAVVFMGDTGSQFIGFMAAFLSIYLTQNVYQTLNPALPLLLLGLPILDTLLVMARRIKGGRSPFSPDKTHIHHRLMQYGFSHPEAVATIYVFQGLYLLAAFNFRYASDLVVLGVYLLISVSILLFFYWAGHRESSLRKADENLDRRGGSFWRNIKVFHFARKYIEYSVTIFLLIQIYSLISGLDTVSAFSFSIVIVGVLVFIFMPRVIQDLLVRISVYIATVFSSVMLSNTADAVVLMDSFLFVLILMVSLAVRVTRRSKFRMTTQDVLVVLFVLAVILMADVKLMGHVVFRLFSLAYALEYLLNREIYLFRTVRYSAIISGLLIVIFILPTIS
jgi:UDP-GlcNAc:undecaprenyl-phosphate GlcNAc-1-phosphate transferase